MPFAFPVRLRAAPWFASRTLATAAVLALLASFSACGDDAAPGPLHLNDLPLLTASELRRIGDVEDPDRGFSRIAGLDVGPDGRLYVGEAVVPEIRVLSADGEPIRRIGGRGQGPGEFESPPRFGVVGDTIWTLQSFNGRIALFDTTGAVLSTGTTQGLRVPLPEGAGYVMPHEMEPGGLFTGHFSLVRSHRGDEPTGVSRGDAIPWPWVRFDAAGEVVDTLGWAPHPPQRMYDPSPAPQRDWVFVEIAGRRYSVPSAPRNLSHWLPRPNGYVLVETPDAGGEADGEIVLTRMDMTGDTAFATRIRYTPLPFTEADLDSIAVWAARGEPGGFAPFRPGQPPPDDWRVIANRLRAEMDFPAFQSPLLYAWSGEDGSTWLRLNGDRTASSALWVVVAPDGEVVGKVELPVDLNPLWAADGALWASRPDDIGVPWLVEYRIG